MVNCTHYTYRVSWSEDDEEFVALCTEFPSLSFLSKTHIKALVGVLELVEEVVADMAKSGEEIPPPISYKKFSGKFQVRIPPKQHRELFIEAREEGVSLNRHVSRKLQACG